MLVQHTSLALSSCHAEFIHSEVQLIVMLNGGEGLGSTARTLKITPSFIWGLAQEQLQKHKTSRMFSIDQNRYTCVTSKAVHRSFFLFFIFSIMHTFLCCICSFLFLFFFNFFIIMTKHLKTIHLFSFCFYNFFPFFFPPIFLIPFSFNLSQNPTT